MESIIVFIFQRLKFPACSLPLTCRQIYQLDSTTQCFPSACGLCGASNLNGISIKGYKHSFPALILTFFKNAFMDMKKIKIVGILWLLFVAGANAQTVFGPAEETTKINSMQLLNMLTTNDFGESYDPASGTLSLAYTDVSLPGNSPLAVEVRRKMTGSLGTERFAGFWELGDWSLDLPYVRGEFLKAEGQYISLFGDKGWSFGKECEGDVSNVGGRAWNDSGNSWPLSPTHYWTGKFLHIPQQVSENLIWGKGSYAGKQVTKANYIVTSCFNRADGKGQGIVVTAPNGTRYTFDYVVEKPNGMPMPVGNGGYMRWLMATKAEDKFGNTVTYNYVDGLLQSIVASDGRKITLSYSGKYLANVVVNGRTWTYTYDTSVAYRTRLDKVTLPDGKSWTLGKLSRDINAASVERWRSLSQTPGHCEPIPQDDVGLVIETPDKLKISYTFALTYHGIYDTKAYPYGDAPKWQAFDNANCGAYWGLVKKTVTGPGVPLKTWTYAYSQNGGNYYEGTGDGNKYGYGQLQNKRLTESWSLPVALTFPYSKPDSVKDASSVKTTTVTGPNAKEIYYVDRTFDSPTQNMVLAVDTANVSTGKLLKREESYYQKGELFADYCALSFMPALNSANAYKCSIYNNLKNSNYRINLRQKKTILYDAAAVATSYTTTLGGYDFYGFPTLVSEANSYSAQERYTQLNYLHDVNGWVLGLPKSTLVSQYASGPYTEINRIDYVGKSVAGRYYDVNVADKVYSYGVLDKVFKAYHDDGNIKRIESANANRWVEYSNYKRGEAQKIMTPSSGSSTPQYTYKVIDDNGWVKKITDPNGYMFNYKYNANGLLTNTSYENTLWFPTRIEYLTATGLEGIAGVVSGMQMQRITKGNYSKNIYYDALNRPLVIQEEDIADAQTKRFFARKYDINNNITFDAYPSSAAGSNIGVAYGYDALGRNTKVTQDSSNGKVSSSKEYRSDNKIAVTDFKANVTVNEYLAYGQPEYEKLLSIHSPESVLTNIAYNIFGNATSIAQGGITQYNVYDAQQQLCKQIRPDVGNKAFHYNKTGEVDWFAHSNSVSATTTECDYVVDAADKVANAYDNFGKIKSVSYGDGTSSKVFTYDKRGNVSKLEHAGYTLSYSYDLLNNLRSEKIEYKGSSTTVARSIAYEFNSAGHLRYITYPGSLTLKYYPNALGQTTMIKEGMVNAEPSLGADVIVYAKNIKYHPSGAVDSYTYGNNLNYKLAQNSQLLPESISIKNPSNSLMTGFVYAYDKNSNIERITDSQNSAFNMSMTYDGLNRLKTATGNWGAGVYNYDTLGNITSYKLGGFSLSYAYNSNKRLTGVTGSKRYAFTYDERANITGNSSFAGVMTYNLENQMKAAGSATYTYDGFNRRVKKYSPVSGTEEFIYSKSGVLMWGKNTNYIYLGNQLIAKDKRAGGVVYVHTDHLGSVVAESNSAGKITKRFHYKPFGESIETQQDDVGYSAHKFDADLGLSYMQARYYDPVLGRFYSNDPVGFTGAVNTFNRYSYVGNNPVNKIDPTGMYQDSMYRVQSQINDIASGASTIADFQETQSYENEGTLIAASIAVGGFSGGGIAVNSVRGMSTAAKGKIGEVVTRAGIAARGEKVIASQRPAGKVGELGSISGRGANAKPDFVVKDKSGNVKVVEAKFGSSNLTGAQRDLKKQMGDAFTVSRTTYDDVANAGATAGAATGAATACVATTSNFCR